MCVSSLDLKLAMAGYSTALYLDRGLGNHEAVFIVPCHFVDYDDLIEGGLEGTVSNFDEENGFGPTF